jgi:serine/threonine-protein kinase HipA
VRHVTVHVRLPSGESIAGAELAIDDEVSRLRGGGSFRYRGEYLQHPEAYPFDPINLPLGPGEVETEGLPAVPSAIAEALPDRWGRRLLARQHRIGEDDVPALLLVARPPTVGALSFWREEADEAASAPELAELVEAALALEQGLPVEPQSMVRLLRHGSSVGGVRPKALFRDDAGQYLAKFPSARDPVGYSIPRLEAASLSLAEAAGLEACRYRTVRVADQDVLLVHRFDLIGRSGRRHILSLRALGVGPDGRVYGYREAAALVRRISSDIEGDLRRFFRQMIFNVAIGNTDDHEGNFSFLFDGNGWSLSPAYDLLPNVAERPEHGLDFVSLSSPPDRWRAVSMAPAFGLTASDAAQEIDDVVDAVGDLWRTRCQDHGIDIDDRWFWVRDLDRRLRSLQAR